MHILEFTIRLRVWKIAERSFPDVQLHPPGPSSCVLIGHVRSEEVFVPKNERQRNDSEILVRSCLTGKSHQRTGHRPSCGGEPTPFLNGNPVGQDKFLLPPRTNNVTSTLAGHRASADRLPVLSRHRQSVYGCLEQLVPGTSGARVRLTRTLRNLPASSVRDSRNTTAPGKAKKYPCRARDRNLPSDLGLDKGDRADVTGWRSALVHSLPSLRPVPFAFIAVRSIR
jgi:hypothetical protein